jgi:hypothetical protein
MMRELSWDEFAEAEGNIYVVGPEGGPNLEMTLEKAVELPSAGRAAGSFRLEFRGPFEPILPQAIYPFSAGGERFEIFIVPVGREEKGTLYEAIFY